MNEAVVGSSGRPRRGQVSTKACKAVQVNNVCFSGRVAKWQHGRKTYDACVPNSASSSDCDTDDSYRLTKSSVLGGVVQLDGPRCLGADTHDGSERESPHR